MKVTLKSALLGLVILVLLVSLVPTGFVLDRQLVRGIEQNVRDDLATAPMVLEDEISAGMGAWMMHAKEVSSDGSLLAAAEAGEYGQATVRASTLVSNFAPEERPLIVGADGEAVLGPDIPLALIERTRIGDMPVEAIATEEGMAFVALAPLMSDDGWVGATGVWIPMGEERTDRLSAKTRSNVLLMAPDERLAGYTGRAEPAMGLFDLLGQQPITESVEEFEFAGTRFLVLNAMLPGGARVSFVRDMTEELAAVPALRAAGATVFGAALLLALLVGVGFAARLARPVGSLAQAADRISTGDFDAAVEHSAVKEVDQVAAAFEAMRDALAARIAELDGANRELEDRQERLSMLQAELVQRDRLSAASRLLAQLAHEVRNPVASVRNCLEVLRRRVDGDDEASELADLAIDELLRMHELAEQMLDLHRPQATEGDCDAASVAEDVAAVVRVGLGDRDIDVDVSAPEALAVDIPADPLKQVLLNLMQNAQDALGDRGKIEVRVEAYDDNARIDVVDTGPGISDDALPQIFDPFFTTKADVRGVGLGLFTAAGIVRSHGGRIAAANRADGAGARLTVEVPLVEPSRHEAMA